MIWIIFFLISVFTLYMMRYSTYQKVSYNKTERYKYPMWLYLIMIVCALVPILNLISVIIFWVLMIVDVIDSENLVFKNRLFSFLNKKI